VDYFTGDGSVKMEQEVGNFLAEKDLNNESQFDQEDICFVDLKEEVREEF